MTKYSEIKLLPFDVIIAATQGDTNALRKVTEHYDSYIAKLCMRSFRGKNGDYYYVDEEMRNRLKMRLVERTIKFKLDY